MLVPLVLAGGVRLGRTPRARPPGGAVDRVGRLPRGRGAPVAARASTTSGERPRDRAARCSPSSRRWRRLAPSAGRRCASGSPASAADGRLHPPDLGRFAIGFDERDRARLHELWDEVITSQRWSEGPLTERFEAAWAAWNGLRRGRLLGLDRRRAGRARVRRRARRDRAVPVEHVHGDAAGRGARGRRGGVRRLRPRRPLHVVRGLRGQGRPRTSRRRRSSCTSAGTSRSRSSEIAALCRDEGIFLIEDCAHAHGASWNGRGRARGATPACGRSTPPRRSRRARAGCSSRATRS